MQHFYLETGRYKLYQHVSVALVHERYKDRQINAYDANILLCCGGSDAIKDFVAANYVMDLVKLNDWVYYSPKTGKMVIDSWHPTYTGVTHEKMYTDMMSNVEDALVKINS